MKITLFLFIDYIKLKIFLRKYLNYFYINMIYQIEIFFLFFDLQNNRIYYEEIKFILN